MYGYEQIDNGFKRIRTENTNMLGVLMFLW